MEQLALKLLVRPGHDAIILARVGTIFSEFNSAKDYLEKGECKTGPCISNTSDILLEIHGSI